MASPSMPAADRHELEVRTDIAAIGRDWDALADRLDAVPWLRPGWFEAWWRAFGTGRLAVMALWRDGRLEGVLPLRYHRSAVTSPTNWHTPQFGILAEDARSRRALLDAVFDTRPRSVALHLLDADSPDADAAAEAARRAGYRLTSRVEMRSPYIPTTGSLERLLKARPPGGKLLGELRRRRRRLEARGDVSVRVVTGPERLDELLDTAFRLEAAGWKGREGTAIAARPETRRFYADVARWASSRGSLRLAFLDVAGESIACDLMLEESGSLHVVKRGYDESYRRYGPGNIMMLEALRLAYATGLESLELLGSDEPYKLQWTDLCRTRLLVQAFAPTPLGHAERLLYAHGRPVAKRAMSAVRRAPGR